MNSKSNQKHTELLSQRYGNQKKPENIIWNSQVEGLLAHQSVRNFTTEPLPEGTLETMVAAAQSASTSSNLHQWSVIAVTDQALKEKLAKITRKENGAEGNYYIEQAPVLLLWVADLSRNNAIATMDNEQAEVHHYLDSFLMSSIDAALAAQNAAVAAESIGLGNVYLGAMRNQAKEMGEAVGLPPYSFITFGMLVGHPDVETKTFIRPRPVQQVVLHNNTYDIKGSMEALQSYEDRFQDFRKKSGMKEKQWIAMVKDTANSFHYMGGRQNLRASVEAQGFKLK